MMPPPLARNASSWMWIGVAINAAAGGIFLGWAVANAPLESLGLGGWLRSGAWILAAFVAGPVATMALVRGHGLPAFAEVLGPRAGRPPARVTLAAGLLLAAVFVLATQTALGLVFDPRYQDFPFAPMTAAIVPFAVLAISAIRMSGTVQLAETVAAAILIGSAIYIAPNEGLANWQAIWVVIMLVLLAAILIAPRAARS
jgi:glucan 1,3-beta-glucosidase